MFMGPHFVVTFLIGSHFRIPSQNVERTIFIDEIYGHKKSTRISYRTLEIHNLGPFFDPIKSARCVHKT